MALGKELGYAIITTFDGDKIAGTTQDVFNIAGKSEETLMKSNQGKKQVDNIGVDANFSVNAFVMKGSETGWLNVFDVMELCANNTQANFVKLFGGTDSGKAKVTGVVVFKSFSINSGSDSYADMTVELQVQGTPVVTHS